MSEEIVIDENDLKEWNPQQIRKENSYQLTQDLGSKFGIRMLEGNAIVVTNDWVGDRRQAYDFVVVYADLRTNQARMRVHRLESGDFDAMRGRKILIGTPISRDRLIQVDIIEAPYFMITHLELTKELTAEYIHLLNDGRVKRLNPPIGGTTTTPTSEGSQEPISGDGTTRGRKESRILKTGNSSSDGRVATHEKTRSTRPTESIEAEIIGGDDFQENGETRATAPDPKNGSGTRGTPGNRSGQQNAGPLRSGKAESNRGPRCDPQGDQREKRLTKLHVQILGAGIWLAICVLFELLRK